MYQNQSLSVLAYADSFTLWLYKFDGEFELVFEQDYFNEASDMLRAGDLIIANSTSKKLSKLINVAEVTENKVIVSE